MPQQLTDAQIVELQNIIEGMYGDSCEDLQSAIHDLALEAGPKTVKAFLQENLKGVSESDFMDKSTYSRIKTLMAEL